MSKIYLFSDESGDPNIITRKGERITDKDPDGPKSFFVGVVATDNPAELRFAVSNAFANLKKLATTDEDMRTINRGYFHASFDSYLAKELLAKEISKCHFSAQILEYDKTTFPKDDLRARKQKEFHVQQLVNTMVSITSKYSEIDFTIAERSGSLVQACSDTIDKTLKNYYDWSLIYTPQLPYNDFEFVNLKVEPSMVNEPALQVADFITWAHVRMLNSNDPTFIELLHLSETNRFSEQGEDAYIKGYDFYIGNDILYDRFKEINRKKPYSDKVHDIKKNILEKLKDTLSSLQQITREDIKINSLLNDLYNVGLGKSEIYQLIELWSKRIDSWDNQMDISFEEYKNIKRAGGLVSAERKGESLELGDISLAKWSDYLRKLANRIEI